MSLASQLRRPRGLAGARLVLGLGAVTVWLVLAAIVGALTVGDGDDELVTAGPGAFDSCHTGRRNGGSHGSPGENG